jgi:hypothetical protein
MPKLVHAPHLGHNVRLGGYRPSKHPPHAVRLKHLLTGSIVLPPSTNRRAKADVALRRMFLNDRLGDCVIAGRAHRIGELTGDATGKAFVYTDAQILREYERIGGYNPNDSNTDQGCDMAVAANDGVTHGYADGSKDAGWIAIDPTNQHEVMAALYLFEVGDLGVCLPDAWISPFPSGDGFVWDVAGDPDPNNGHDYQLIDYDTTGVFVGTWGLEGKQTWAALAKYGATAAGGMLIIHLNVDQVVAASHRSPDGVMWDDLIAAFNAMGGNVPVPTPTPVPVPPAPTPTPPGPAPTPAPVVGPTLDAVKGQVQISLDNFHSRLLSRSQAIRAVNIHLTKWWPKT